MPVTSYHFKQGEDGFTIRLKWESMHVEVSTFVESIREPETNPFDFTSGPREWQIVLTPAGERALRDLFECPPPLHMDVTTSPPAARLGPAPKKRSKAK
jgi:hypothetical protein